MATTLVGAIAAMSGWFAVACFHSPGSMLPTTATSAPVDVQPAAVHKPFSPVYRKLEWDDLIPAGWDPANSLNPAEVDGIKDGTGRADTLLSQMRSIWDQAPWAAAGLADTGLSFSSFLELGEQDCLAVGAVLSELLSGQKSRYQGRKQRFVLYRRLAELRAHREVGLRLALGASSNRELITAISESSPCV